MVRTRRRQAAAQTSSSSLLDGPAASKTLDQDEPGDTKEETREGTLAAATAAASDPSAAIAVWSGPPLIGGLSVVAIWSMRDVIRRAGWRGAMYNVVTDASDD